MESYGPTQIPKSLKMQRLRKPPPIEHTDKMSEADVKSPRMNGCPRCGLNSGLGELDLIPGAAYGHFDKNGS